MSLEDFKKAKLITAAWSYELSVEVEGSIIASSSRGKKDEVIQKAREIDSEVNIYKFSYTSLKHQVIGYFIEPKIITKPLPCIVFNRGGSVEFGKINDHLLYLRLSRYAQWGYTVIASQYSECDGSEGKDECGGADLNDVLVLKKILDTYQYSDSSRIAMIGDSRGGMMTYMVMSQVDWVKTAIITGGSTNLVEDYEKRPTLISFRRHMYDIFNIDENIKRSAIYWPEKFSRQTPILLLHGTDDQRVDPRESLEMALAFQESYIPYKLIMYEGDDHSLSKNKKESILETKKWLEKYL
jgi:dipeptidyl aminopeptidase/acylaminoacyl peptidase